MSCGMTCSSKNEVLAMEKSVLWNSLLSVSGVQHFMKMVGGIKISSL